MIGNIKYDNDRLMKELDQLVILLFDQIHLTRSYRRRTAFKGRTNIFLDLQDYTD